jgi:hypothetical protein
MSRARRIAVVSCIAGFAIPVAAFAALAGGLPAYTEYASTFDPAGGFEYIRLVPDHAVLGHLDHALLSGFFYRDDYSKEYAIDDAATLVTVDTSTAAVTTIGQTPFEIWTHLGIAADPSTGLAYALVANDPCTSTDLYGIDLITGAATLIGAYPDGCLEGGLIEPDGTFHAIDSAASALVDVMQGEIGALGFNVGDDATLYHLPGGTTMYLLATDLSVGMMNLYTVDPATGHATLIAPVSAMPGTYTGIAIGPPLPDDVFADGFDG